MVEPNLAWRTASHTGTSVNLRCRVWIARMRRGYGTTRMDKDRTKYLAAISLRLVRLVRTCVLLWC